MKHFLFILVAITLLTKTYAQDTSFLQVVTTHDEIDLSDIDLVAIPTKGPYILAGNQLSSLMENSDLADIVFPDSIVIDDIVWSGNSFIVKSGYAIYSLDNISVPLMDFDTPDFDIYPLDDRRIYIVSHQGSTCHLFLANLKVKRAKRLFTTKENIVDVSQLGVATIVTTEDNIYLFNDKECIRYLNLWAPIKTAVMTDRGLAFATDNEICLLMGVDKFLLLFEAQTKELLCDSKHLYIQLKEGDLLRCDLSAFFKE